MEDLEAFKRARELAKEVYAMTRQPGFASDFALRDQIRRASISIVSNIAEGFARDGRKEFIQFLSQAKGSAAEVQAQLLIALDQKYLGEREHDNVRRICAETIRLISGLMKYLRQSDYQGLKFKKANRESENPKP